MPSFDIVSKVDIQVLDNAVNVVKKEITNRFDFRGSHFSLELNKKDYKLLLEVDNDMQLKQALDVLLTKSMRQGLPAEVFDFSKEEYPSGKVLKKEITVRNGIKQEDAKKIVKAIKDSGIKVQPAIMDDTIRVTGKKIDDLQAVIQLCNNGNFGLALQYVNMKS